MARKKSHNSKLSFKGWGLEREEDLKIIKILKDKDVSANQLVRNLVRAYIKENEPLTTKLTR